MAKFSVERGITHRALLALLLLELMLSAGCTGLPPVYSIVGGGSYKVRSGDTLYSIAFRHGLDYRSLARINGISAPYIIYPEQVIRLHGSEKQPENDYGPPATRSSNPATVVSKKYVLPNGVARWRWPLKGEIISGFSLATPVNNGIDIAAKEGELVKAAADGVVVYAGGNLRGYGKLVIIKHTDIFLSAYGNNAALLVAEGDEIKAGRLISRVGPGEDKRQMLHFEIRREGKPVDPLRLLPTL